MYQATINDLVKAGVDPHLADKITKKRQFINPELELDKILRTGVSVLTQEDTGFPDSLKTIHSSPPLIYLRGDPTLLSKELLAVVGSRKITSYGKNVVEHLVPSICDLDVGIVSGMAYGVDAAALEACISHGGKPVAVLASSLLYGEISPKANFQLAQKIEQVGCLISENPPGGFVGKMHFPLRNRIVSALSLGIVIIEAGLKSGSLGTAKIGLEQGKEIFAVPGSIFSPNSEGTLDLIKRGAKCVTSIQDIAQEFGWDVNTGQQILEFTNANHKLVIESIHQGYNTVDSIAQQTKFNSHQVLTIITELELLGALHKGGNGVYHKVR